MRADSPAADAARDPCTGHECRHFAMCETRDGKPDCVCPQDCQSSDRPAVCGTDGRRYKSMCHLMLRACRRQRPIRLSLADRC